MSCMKLWELLLLAQNPTPGVTWNSPSAPFLPHPIAVTFIRKDCAQVPQPPRVPQHRCSGSQDRSGSGADLSAMQQPGSGVSQLAIYTGLLLIAILVLSPISPLYVTFFALLYFCFLHWRHSRKQRMP